MAIVPIRNLGGGGGSVSKTLYLYKNGDECTSVTNGWALSCQDSTTKSKYTFTKNSTNMTLQRASTGTVYYSCICTQKKVDLTSYNKLIVDCTSGYNIGISSANQNTSVDLAMIKNTTSSKELDISSYSGEYYISLGAVAGSTVTYNMVWLEK